MNTDWKMTWVQMPVYQLFDEHEVDGVKDMYKKIQQVATSPQKIIIYCNEDTIKWNPAINSWEDTGYTYKDKSGKQKAVAVNIHVGNQHVKPGMQGVGASYTTLGKCFLVYYPYAIGNMV
jgi:hypothetical protein